MGQTTSLTAHQFKILISVGQKKWCLDVSKLINVYHFHLCIRNYFILSVSLGVWLCQFSFWTFFMRTSYAPPKYPWWSEKSQDCIIALWFRITPLRGRLREVNLNQDTGVRSYSMKIWNNMVFVEGYVLPNMAGYPNLLFPILLYKDNKIVKFCQWTFVAF